VDGDEGVPVSDGGGGERRHDPRAERISLVHLVRRGAGGAQEELATGRTLNLSLGGIRVALDHALPIGSRVDLTVLLGGDLIDIGGTVVYEEEEVDNFHAVGIEFVDLSPTGRARIERYLQHPPPAGGPSGP
jgi:c-di-GMP-binding flagellar brake protein YcgR